MYYRSIAATVAGIALATSPAHAMIEILGGDFRAVAEVRINDELVRDVNERIGVGGGAEARLSTPIAFGIAEANYFVELVDLSDDDSFFAERLTVQGFASEQSDLNQIPPPPDLMLNVFASVDASILFRVSEVPTILQVFKEDLDRTTLDGRSRASAEVTEAATGEIVIPTDAQQGETYLLDTGDYEIRWHHDWGGPVNRATDVSPDGTAVFPSLMLFSTPIPEPGSVIVWSFLGIALIGYTWRCRLRPRS